MTAVARGIDPFRPARRAALLVGTLSALALARADVSTLEHSVMVGYQGWFRAPGDGSGLGWSHYQKGGARPFNPARMAIDYWPDLSGFTAAERYPTPLRGPDGSAAALFSSHNPLTVDRHFGWMAGYGIDGAFVQRFPSTLAFDDPGSRRRRRATDDVLLYAARAAERHGRSFAVMYDLTGLPAGAMGRVEADWRHLVTDLGIRRSPAYQRHRGKPVVAVWGVGFNDGRAYTLPEVAGLVEFLKRDPQCGGNTVMLGVPTGWREQTVDAVNDPRLSAVLAQADIISPWTPGRYYDLGGVRAHAERFWKPDLAWCARHRIDYMPVVFPGFRWRNLRGTRGGIDRLDGRFLWEQYRQAIGAGASMVYQAMFDEMNEGTQIFKVSNRPPAGAAFGTYGPLPSDQYLWLTGLAARYLREGRTMPERMPERGIDPALDRALRAGDAAIYAEAEVSFEAQRRFFAIEDELTAHTPDWAPDAGTGARVRAIGSWQPRFASSPDPAAVFEWEFPAPAAGDYEVEIRYPGDPNEDHATAARLTVSQNGRTMGPALVNLRSGALHWRGALTVRLAGPAPCRVSLAAPAGAAGAGHLVPFEARLVPRF